MLDCAILYYNMLDWNVLYYIVTLVRSTPSELYRVPRPNINFRPATRYDGYDGMMCKQLRYACSLTQSLAHKHT